MTARTTAATAALVLGVLALVPGFAEGQGRGRERAIFGGGRPGAVGQTLDLTSNLGATFHDPIRDPLRDASGLQSDWLGQASTSLGYGLDHRLFRANASLSAFSYYRPEAERPWLTDYAASANASTGKTWQLTRRSQLTFGQTASLQPSFFGTTPPGAFAQPGGFSDPSLFLPPEVTDVGGHHVSSTSSLDFGFDASRRTTITAGYAFERTWTFGDDDTTFDLYGHRANADIRFAVTRHLGIRAGYRAGYTRFLESDRPSVVDQNAEFGADYNRGGSIQLTRRTTWNFGGGVTAIADAQRRQHYTFIGNTGLTHDIGRTWRAAVSYRRNLEYTNLVDEPVLADTAAADIDGLISSRVSFRAGVAYSQGTVGFAEANNNLDRITGLVSITSAINRYLAVGTSYSYYSYEIGNAVDVRPEFAGRLEGQSARIYLTAWAPLFNRSRRPNASR